MADKRTIMENQRKRRPGAKKSLSGVGQEHELNTQGINHEHERLIQWLKTVRFRKVLFGGVDERQLWKKLEELNRLYEAAISAERARYDALLAASRKKEEGESR